MARPQTVVLPAETPGERETRTEDVITLSGYFGSPESRALAEWREFSETYDRVGAMLAAVGNGSTGLDERFSLYQVYTETLAERLEEFDESYGLSLHTEWMEMTLYPEAFETCRIIQGKGNRAYSASMYEDGTVYFAGVRDFPGYGSVC